MKETITNLTRKLYSQRLDLSKTIRSLSQLPNRKADQSNEYYVNDLDLILDNYYKRQALSEKIEKMESEIKTSTEELKNLLVLLDIPPGKAVYASDQDASGTTIRIWLQNDPQSGYSLGTSF